MKEPTSVQQELDWSAFCYAAGEMTPSEAAAFELRLAEDQTAREALARAVELTEVVATAESLEPLVTVGSRPVAWSRRLSWMAIGSAASLLVALLWSGAGSWLDRGKVAVVDQNELARAWTETRAELAASDSELWFPKHLAANEATGNEAAESAESGGGDAQSLGTPDWLTAAVESYAADPADPDTTPFDSDRREN